MQICAPFLIYVKRNAAKRHIKPTFSLFYPLFSLILFCSVGGNRVFIGKI